MDQLGAAGAARHGGGTGPLTAGVVGAGTGGMLSVRALLASERFRLVGVADTSGPARDKVAQEVPGVAVFPDAGALLDEAHPEVVCVSTFAPSHGEVVDLAVAAGVRGVLLEKPIAPGWREGRRVLDLLADRRVPVVVPHGLLVHGASKEVLRRAHGGEIGDIEMIEVQCAGWDIINAGIHWVDFALALLRDDEVQRVQAACDVSTRTFRDGMEVETEAVTHAVTRSGARLVMETGDDVRAARAGKDLVYRIYGSLGSIEFWGWEDGFLLRTAGNGPQAGAIATPPDVVPGHQVYLEMLADMVQSGGPQYELAELSLRALEVCEAAYLSARHGCVVRLPLEGFVPEATPEWRPGTPYRGEGGRNGRQL